MAKKTYCGHYISAMGDILDNDGDSDVQDSGSGEGSECSADEREREGVEHSKQHKETHNRENEQLNNNTSTSNRTMVAGGKRKLTTEEKEEFKEKIWASFKKKRNNQQEKRALEDREYTSYTYMKDLIEGELYFVEEIGYGQTPYVGRSLVATLADSEKCVYHVPMNKTYAEELAERWCVKKERHIWMIYNGMKMSGKWQRKCQLIIHEWKRAYWWEAEEGVREGY